ncbi:MAG: hypothetical protein JHC77_04335 [Opitutales bacterium]|jgi:hypothetical protein|nr:hypothetical protein [Opitutales bacterium]
MPLTSSKLTWCTIRLRKDTNRWWVKENSDPKHYEPDGLGILDPHQLPWILDNLDPLREYGLSNEILEAAFVPFQIHSIEKDKDETVRLARVAEHILDSEELLFALPNVKDGEKGSYADFLEHITRLRVKFINDTIKLEQKLTIEDVDEQLSDLRNQALIEGRDIHPFEEITDILEFVPAGHEVPTDDDDDDKPARPTSAAEEITDLPEVEDDDKLNKELKWDEEERPEDVEGEEGGESRGNSRRR